MDVGRPDLQILPSGNRAGSGNRTSVEGRRLSDEAAKLGLHYLAVLVPVKTAVYQHLIAPPMGRGPVPPGTVTETERQLTAAGVRVLNLFEPLASRATSALPRHQYVY